MSDDHQSPGSNPTPPSSKPKLPSSGALVVLSLVLLAALVWAMSPGRAKFTPAPLREVPSGCGSKSPDFVPTDATEVRGLDWSKFSAAQKNHLLYRLNMEPCPCGCNSSVAGCRNGHPACPVNKEVVDKMMVEEENPQTGAPTDPDAK